MDVQNLQSSYHQTEGDIQLVQSRIVSATRQKEEFSEAVQLIETSSERLRLLHGLQDSLLCQGGEVPIRSMTIDWKAQLTVWCSFHGIAHKQTSMQILRLATHLQHGRRSLYNATLCIGEQRRGKFAANSDWVNKWAPALMLFVAVAPLVQIKTDSCKHV